MNLTGQELINKRIVTGNVSLENIQQHGVDLNLRSVERVIGIGFIPKEGKTLLSERENIKPEDNIFSLEPGVYDFVFEQGCNIPHDQRAEVIQRSSCSRNGLFIRSAVFDAGFKTEQVGTMVIVMNPIRIEKGARVAQFVCEASNVVEKTYNGQWQGDSQRKTEI